MSDGLVRGAQYGVVLACVVRDPNLSPRARTTYAILATYCGGERSAFPSIATITDALGGSDASTHRAIRELVDAGHLRAVPRMDDQGRQRSNLYVLDPLGEGVTHDTPGGITRDRGEGVTGDTHISTTREHDQKINDDDARVREATEPSPPKLRRT